MIAKNGFTPGHTGHTGSNGEARYRHQASGEEKKQPEAAKPYTSDQLEAVKRCVHSWCGSDTVQDRKNKTDGFILTGLREQIHIRYIYIYI